MAYIAIRPAPFPNLTGGFRHTVASLWLARKRRSIFLHTRNELRAQSNRCLADLGISRSEIDRVARESARQATR